MRAFAVTDFGAAAVRALHPNGVDVVFHFAGDPAALLPAVREGGLFITTLLMSADQLPTETARVVPTYANPSQAVLDRLASNQAEGRTRVVVERQYRLAEVAAALTDFAKGTLGKLVVVID